MQNDTAYGCHATSAMPQSHTDDAVFASLYSAIFDRKASVSQYDVESDHSSSSAHRHRQLYNALLVQDHQEMVNRHQETSEEADALRHESALRSLNLELNKHLSLLIHASVQKQFGSPSSVQTTAPFGIVNGLHDMKIDDKRAEQDMSDESPMSVIESEGGDAKNIDVERFLLPKSISVRSDGYVKAAQAAQAGASTAQIKEGSSLKSLSVWLKFLFQNPTSCGCSLSVDGDRIVTQHKRKRDCDSSWPADVAVHKRYFHVWLIRSCFSCQRRATTKIKSAIPHRQAEVEFQWIVRGQNSRSRLLGAASLNPIVRNGCPLNSTGALYMALN